MRQLQIRFCLPSAARLLVVALAFTSMGCVTGRLQGVITDDRLAAAPENQLVRIERDGRPTSTRLGMGLKKGDRIITASGTRAVITFARGRWKVILEPESEIEIRNPSIFVRIGGAIVKGIGRIRKALKVETEWTLQTPKGTLYKIEVRGDEVTYKVVEGQLLVTSRRGLWEPILLESLDQISIPGSAPPQRDQLDSQEATEIRREALQVLAPLEEPLEERQSPPPAPEPAVYDSKYYCTLAIETFQRGSRLEAADLAQKALDLHQQDRRLSESEYDSCRKLAAGTGGAENVSSSYCAQAVEAARRGDVKGAADLARKALDLHQQDGRLSESEHDTCRKLAAGTGGAENVSSSYCAQAVEAARRGDIKGAADLARKALDLHRQDGRLSESEHDTCRKLAAGTGGAENVSSSYCAQAVEAARRGDVKGAADLARKALDLHQQDGRLSESEHDTCRKLAAGTGGAENDSSSYCAQAVEAARRGDVKGAADLARKALDLHQQDGRLSESEHDTCRKLAAGTGGAENDSSSYCAQAVEAARRGDPKGAADLARKALDLHQQDRRLSESEYDTCRKLTSGKGRGRADSSSYCAQAVEASKRGDMKRAADLAHEALKLNEKDRRLSKAEYETCRELTGSEK